MTALLASLGPLDYLLHPDKLLSGKGSVAFFIIVVGIVFAESGLLVGFFLPGDALLFSAGLLVANGRSDLNIAILVAGIIVAAIVGDQVGYLFGRRVGPSLFTRPDSRIFRQSNVTKAHEFFEHHGARAIILARFVPVVRTFTPIVAGVSDMEYRTFVRYNVVGGIGWSLFGTLLGYGLGKQFPKLESYLLPILLLIAFLSSLPIVLEVLKARREGRRDAQTPAEALVDDD